MYTQPSVSTSSPRTATERLDAATGQRVHSAGPHVQGGTQERNSSQKESGDRVPHDGARASEEA